MTISFRSLRETDIPRLHLWFNAPHVQEFYSLREWTLDEVVKKLKPQIDKKKPIHGFIIFLNQDPVGYIQYYRLEDYPWPGQDIEEDVIAQAAGFDLFIGEISLVGKGIGSQIVAKFLKSEIWSRFHYCFVDPDARNRLSIRMFEKCGFRFHKMIQTTDALGREVELCLLKMQNDALSEQ